MSPTHWFLLSFQVFLGESDVQDHISKALLYPYIIPWRHPNHLFPLSVSTWKDFYVLGAMDCEWGRKQTWVRHALCLQGTHRYISKREDERGEQRPCALRWALTQPGNRPLGMRAEAWRAGPRMNERTDLGSHKQRPRVRREAQMGFKKCQVLRSPLFSLNVQTCEGDEWATIKTKSPKIQGWAGSWLEEGKALPVKSMTRCWQHLRPLHRPVLASVCEGNMKRSGMRG